MHLRHDGTSGGDDGGGGEKKRGGIDRRGWGNGAIAGRRCCHSARCGRSGKEERSRESRSPTCGCVPYTTSYFFSMEMCNLRAILIALIISASVPDIFAYVEVNMGLFSFWLCLLFGAFWNVFRPPWRPMWRHHCHCWTVCNKKLDSFIRFASYYQRFLSNQFLFIIFFF